MNILDQLKGYRTLIVQAVVVGASLLVMLNVLPASKLAGVTADSTGAAVDSLIGALGIFVAFVNSVMRLFTTTPAGQPAPVAATTAA